MKTYDPSVFGPSKSFGLLHPAGISDEVTLAIIFVVYPGIAKRSDRRPYLEKLHVRGPGAILSWSEDSL